MANAEQLEILLSGVWDWNRWREENPGAEIDLQEIYLQEPQLLGANLRRADLRGVKFVKGALRGADLREAQLQHSQLQEARLIEADLRGAHLRRAQLEGAQFHKANLEQANLAESNLREADLRLANALEANFSRAHLREANLQRAFLGKANFLEARIEETLFVDTDFLAQAKGLESCIHLRPSTIDHRTLKAAQGQLPDAFLKGCGFQDWEILNAKLHDPDLSAREVTDIGYEVINLRTRGPIFMKQLFISYSHADSAFVDFIQQKLDSDGIRSWRDIHDMDAGPMEDQVDAAISANQVVLLVLSRNSLNSDWVEYEVDKARKIQKQLRNDVRDKSPEEAKSIHVLCPVAIDDSWKNSEWTGALMLQLKKYNILDFSSWAADGADVSYQKLKRGIAKYYT